MAEKNKAVEIDSAALETGEKVDAPAKAKKQKFDFNNLNTLSVVSLATSVTGFGALAGVITGHIALSQIKSSKQSGRPLALAGVIVGYVFVGLGILGFIAKTFFGPRYGVDFVGITGIMPGNPEHMGQFGNDGMGGMMGGDGDFDGGRGHMGDMDGDGGMFRIDPTDPNAPIEVDPNATDVAPTPTN